MTQYITSAAEWLPLTPAPLNHASIQSTISIDGQNIFAYDGTNFSIFQFATLAWTAPLPCPYLNFATLNNTCGIMCSQIYMGFVQVIDFNSQATYLVNIKSASVKTLPNFGSLPGATNKPIFSSDYESYLNNGYIFPVWDEYLMPQGSAFYVHGYPRTLFFITQGKEGPVNISFCFGVDLILGVPISQFIGGNIFSAASATQRTQLPDNYQNGGVFYKSSDVYDMLNAAPIINYHSTITCNGIIYPTITLAPLYNMQPYAYSGFNLSNADLMGAYSGAMRPNFLYLLNVGGNPFSYTPTKYLSADYSIGEYGLGIAVPPPISIPENIANYGPGSAYSTHVYNQNLFGFFSSDFSQGFYLGIASAEYFGYSLTNYSRTLT